MGAESATLWAGDWAYEPGEYTEGEKPVQDHDSNGWPQTIFANLATPERPAGTDYNTNLYHFLLNEFRTHDHPTNGLTGTLRLYGERSLSLENSEELTVKKSVPVTPAAVVIPLILPTIRTETGWL